MEVMISGIRYVPERQFRKTRLPIGELIQSARHNKLETLEKAAKNIGTTKSHLWSIENGGAMPRLPMIQKILQYYGLLFEDIADEY